MVLPVVCVEGRTISPRLAKMDQVGEDPQAEGDHLLPEEIQGGDLKDHSQETQTHLSTLPVLEGTTHPTGGKGMSPERDLETGEIEERRGLTTCQ